ncbi:MAG: nitrile hydratase subunit beta [Acidobacteriaceae bacterium]|nr:nitrile hydratase subunit beta [Acidobacteriaceae bacterium]
MNGIHDMGGMHGMGPIRYEENEPVFHEPWEGRIFAITIALGAWKRWNIDAGRHTIEQISPADYLRMSYYEKWLARNIALSVKHGLVTQQEIDVGRPAPGSTKATPPLTSANLGPAVAPRPGYARPEADAKARFSVGDRVRARKSNPPGHTRLPRYVRGREGVVDRHRGVFVFPDTNAHFHGEDPQHLYSVRFRAQELWGESASPKDSVYLDLWDGYLERA